MTVRREKHFKGWIVLDIAVLFCLVSLLHAQPFTMQGRSGFGFSGGRTGWGAQTNQLQGSFGRSNQGTGLQTHTMQQRTNTQQTMNRARPWQTQPQTQAAFSGNTNNFRTNQQTSANQNGQALQQTRQQGNQWTGNTGQSQLRQVDRNNIQQGNQWTGNTGQSQLRQVDRNNIQQGNQWTGNTGQSQLMQVDRNTIQQGNQWTGSTGQSQLRQVDRNNIQQGNQWTRSTGQSQLRQVDRNNIQQGNQWTGSTGQSQLRQVDRNNRLAPASTWQNGVNTGSHSPQHGINSGRQTQQQQPVVQLQSNHNPHINNNWSNMQTHNTDFHSPGNTVQFNNPQQVRGNTGHVASSASQQHTRRIPAEGSSTSHRLALLQHGQRQQRFVSTAVQATNQNQFNTVGSQTSDGSVHNQVRKSNNVPVTNSNTANTFMVRQHGQNRNINNQRATHPQVSGHVSNVQQNIAPAQARSMPFSPQMVGHMQQNVQTNANAAVQPVQTVQRRFQGDGQAAPNSFSNVPIGLQSQRRNIGSHQPVHNPVNNNPSRTVQSQQSDQRLQQDSNNLVMQRNNHSHQTQNRGIGANPPVISTRLGANPPVINARQHHSDQNKFPQRSGHRIITGSRNRHQGRRPFTPQSGHNNRNSMPVSPQIGVNTAPHASSQSRQNTHEALHAISQTGTRPLPRLQMDRRHQAIQQTRNVLPNTVNQIHETQQHTQQQALPNNRRAIQVPNERANQHQRVFQGARHPSIDVFKNTPQQGRLSQSLNQNGVIARSDNRLRNVDQSFASATKSTGQPVQTLFQNVIPRRHDAQLPFRNPNPNNQQRQSSHSHHLGSITNGQTNVQVQHVNANDQNGRQTHVQTSHMNTNNQQVPNKHGGTQHAMSNVQHGLQTHDNDPQVITGDQQQIPTPVHPLHTAASNQHGRHTHAHTVQSATNDQHGMHSHVHSQHATANDHHRIQTHSRTVQSTQKNQQWSQPNDHALHSNANNPQGLQTLIQSSHSTANNPQRLHTHIPASQQITNNQHGLQPHVQAPHSTATNQQRPQIQNEVLHSPVTDQQGAQTHVQNTHVATNNQNGLHGPVPHLTANDPLAPQNAAPNNTTTAAALSPLSPEGIAQILTELGINVQTPTSQSVPQPGIGGGNISPIQAASHMHTFPRWDGSAASVPHHLAMQGINHGSQFSPYMQQMWFGDTIDPPDTPDPTPKPSNATLTTTAAVVEMEGAITSTTVVPETTTSIVSKITTPMLAMNDKSAINSPQKSDIVMEIAQSLALLLGGKDTTTQRQDTRSIIMDGSKGSLPIKLNQGNRQVQRVLPAKETFVPVPETVPMANDIPTTFSNQHKVNARPQIDSQFRHAVPIANDIHYAHSDPGRLHDVPQTVSNTRQTQLFANERPPARMSPNSIHVPPAAGSNMRHTAPPPLSREQPRQMHIPRVDISNRNARIASAELPFSQVRHNVAHVEQSDFKRPHSHIPKPNTVVMAPSVPKHMSPDLNSNTFATMGRHNVVANTKDNTNLQVMDLMEKIRYLLRGSLLMTTTQTSTPTTTIRPTTTTTTPRPTTPIPTRPFILKASHSNHHSECNYRSPNFQCRGKELFAALKSTAAWCVAMCIRRKCIQAVCECNCNKDSAPFMPSPNKGKSHKTTGAMTHPAKQKKQTLKHSQGTRSAQVNNLPKKEKQVKRLKQTHTGRTDQTKKKQHKLKKVVESKPLVTTEEPPEFEAEDMTTTTIVPMTTTTIVPVPTTTFAAETTWTSPTVGWFVTTPTPLPANKDISLIPIFTQDNTNAHITALPQLLWASELKSRLRILARNAMRKPTTPPPVSFLGIAVTTPKPPYVAKTDRNINMLPQKNIRRNQNRHIKNAKGVSRNINKRVRQPSSRNPPPRITKGRWKKHGSIRKRFKHPFHVRKQLITTQKPTVPPTTMSWNPLTTDVIPTVTDVIPTVTDVIQTVTDVIPIEPPSSNHWNEPVTTVKTRGRWVFQQWGESTTPRPRNKWVGTPSEMQWRNQPSTENPQSAGPHSGRQWQVQTSTERPHAQWAGHHSDNKWQGHMSTEKPHDQWLEPHSGGTWNGHMSHEQPQVQKSHQAPPPTDPPHNSWKEPARGHVPEPYPRGVSNNSPTDQWQNTVPKSPSQPRERWQDNRPTEASRNSWQDPGHMDRQTGQWRDPAPTPRPRDPWHDSVPSSRGHRNNPTNPIRSRGYPPEPKPDHWRDPQPAYRSRDQWKHQSPTAPPRNNWRDQQPTGRSHDRWLDPQLTQRSGSSWDTGRSAIRQRSTPAPRWGGGSRDTWRQPISGGGRGSWGEPPPLRESGSRDTWRSGSSWRGRSSGGSGSYYRPRWDNTTRKPKNGGEQEPPEAPDK